MQRVKHWGKRAIGSKLIVVLAMLVFGFAGAYVNQASASYKAGVSYQYYLLGSKAESLQEGAKDKKLPLKLGSLGSGGASGHFSYDEVVNTVSSGEKNEAEKFASTMSTYSTFNYFSAESQGFMAVFTFLGRLISIVILGTLGVLMDIINLIVPALISLIAKLNVVRLLASAITNLNITSDLTTALGISKDTFEKISSALLSLAVGMILLSVLGMFRRGGRIHQQSYNKLKGRLISLIVLPLIVGIGASMLEMVVDVATKNDNIAGNYSRYLVDDRSWAYNFNFAPHGDSGAETDITPTTGSSYVDLKYNPYTEEGAKRIKEINSESSLANNHRNNIFPNTALAISFATSEHFTATDFINYKGTKASEYFYGQKSGVGNAFGSYYQYAENMGKPDENNKIRLTDIENSYVPSNGDLRRGDGAKTAQKGGYSASIADYSDSGKLTVTPQIAWRDRYIYGVKSSGTNIDKYYAEPPSLEQMENEVGTNGEAAFSDQSMFLILSTKFGETGGTYAISAPGHGIMNTVASFDSDRSNYFVVSMVGNPFFTMFGLISGPLLQLVVFLAVTAAVITIGFIDMNLRPLVAWFKGVTLGDIEYSIAFLVYCVGIAGTVLSIVVIPPLIVNFFLYIPRLLLLAFTVGKTAVSPQASLALYGTPLIISAIFSIVVAFLFVKSKKFNKGLTELFTFVWAWAKSTGERLEIQASGGAGMRTALEQQKARQKFDQNIQNIKTGIDWIRRPKVPTDPTNPPEDPLDNPNVPPRRVDNYQLEPIESSSSDGQEFGTNKALDANTIAQNGRYARAKSYLQENELDKSLSPNMQVASIEATERLKEFKKSPNIDTYKVAMQQLDVLEIEMRQEGHVEKIPRITKTKEELHNMYDMYTEEKSPSYQNSRETTNHTISKGIDPATPNPKSKGIHSEENPSPPISKKVDKHTISQKEKHQQQSGDKSTIFVHEHEYETHNTSETILQHYETKEVQQVVKSLGGASENTAIAKSLDRLNNSKSTLEAQKSIVEIKETIPKLSAHEKEGINQDDLRQSLDNVVQYKKEKEKYDSE
ncbi:hypothetical protein HCB27_16645 [Listeria booriae]|uniref:Uncharacterized protein n=1 Tax=Listeria booriae TaxID=1552123 RepID=A0A7X0Z916_9LIST|nr:hypothetical protein [Listeria booriae]MBC2178214.1 hypothetical protein [Listeria booriae]MBC2178259.1 hypothetical protein [Listeria booriae]